MSPTTKSSTRLLSEVAKELVVPSGIVSTGWPAVRFQLQKLGLGFDGWQQGASKLILGKRANGLYACTVGGAFLSIPRQVGKTYMVGALVFALSMLFPGLTVIWTAHRLKTAGETFRAMQGMARRKAIAPFVANVRRGSGDWAIEFTNGSRILFGARETGFGRGFAKVDVLVLDEGQILTDKALDDLLPAMNASTQPSGGLLISMGTPPVPTDPSEVWLRARDEALSGVSDDVLWVEFGPRKRVDPTKWAPGFVDFEAFEEANPSVPHRTPKAAIMRMAKRLSRESLSREGLGQYDDRVTSKATIPAGKWTDGVVESAPDGKPAFGVKFSTDGERVSLAAAVADGDSVHVEVVAQMSTADPMVGDKSLAEWLAQSWRECVEIVIDGKAGAGALESELLRLKVSRTKLRRVTVDQAVTAHKQFLDGVAAGQVTHIGQAELNQCVRVATRRPIGTTGGWGWQPIGDGDVLDLEAATMAHHGAKSKKPTGVPRRIY